MSTITTHVLDVVRGKPAAGIAIRLEKQTGNRWVPVASGETDGDGRCDNLKEDADLGTYRLTFGTGNYLERLGRTSIYPEVAIVFDCRYEAHYHLPLLLSENSYTTYRGS